LVVVLVVPIVPFLVFGSQLESWLAAWLATPPSAPVTAGVVIGLLGTDVFLPVPSSLVNTLAGAQLGVAGGTAASCTGMTLGAVFGFALARRWGRPLAQRLSAPDDLQRVENVTQVAGPGVLVALRGVPVLAEASVLLAGIHGLAWRRFLPPVIVSNLGISLAYAAFGRFASRHEWLPAALGISLALPVVIAVSARRWLSSPKQD
jgi:uncharacterized membrane protein YdjX (TVP38/TMEM64 family)